MNRKSPVPPARRLLLHSAFQAWLWMALSLTMAVLLPAEPPARGEELSNLLAVQVGTLPVVLAAPHGGSGRIPGVPERLEGVRVQDTFTDDVVRLVAERLAVMAEARPHTIVARFHRKYLDANRDEGAALADPAARPVYQAYHQALRTAVEAARRNPKGGLLLDLHGQAKDVETVHRGTRDGLTVSRILAERGPDALTGPDSILGGLTAAKFTVFPPNTPPGQPNEARNFRGGFTVATYGSHQPAGIDAIQLEIGQAIRRDPQRRAAFAAALAEAINRYYRTYLRP